MDDKRFDTITQALATGGSRRRMLGGLFAGAAALLTGATALEAKRGGKGKGRGRGRRNNGNGNGGNGRGAGTEKVQICHRNRGRKRFNLIEVGAPAVPAHERHGDTVCEQEACFIVTGCDEDGACVSELAPEGTACETDDDVVGTCDSEGACIAEDDDGDD